MCGASASAASDTRAARAGVPWHRLPLLLCGATALIVGICTGLVRLGLDAPLAALSEYHGPLLICGLFGTLTSLERAAMSHRRLDYAGPVLCAGGTVLILCGAAAAGAVLYMLAAAAVSAATLRSVLIRKTLFATALAASAMSWLAGNVVWFYSASVPSAAGWWLAFLVFVIGGERLEFGGPGPKGYSFVLLFWASVAFMAAGGWITIAEPAGALASGIGLILSGIWMMGNDMTLCRLRHRGKARFLIVNLAAGYAWLTAGGLIQLMSAPGTNAFTYDMTIHAVVIGFALSMVFGHALLVFPSILRIQLAFSRKLYVPLILLHAALVLRITGGLMEWNEARMLSGPMTALALAAFAAIVALGTLRMGRALTQQARA